jgi:hypothetical protein
VGALTLAASLVLTLRSFRVRFEDTAAPVRVSHPMATAFDRSGAHA